MEMLISTDAQEFLIRGIIHKLETVFENYDEMSVKEIEKDLDSIKKTVDWCEKHCSVYAEYAYVMEDVGRLRRKDV